jgi:hypothetical protein
MNGLRRKGRRALAVAAGALALIAGIAYAGIPGSSGVIQGCYENRTGLLRVIDAEAGKSCTRFETPINWNQTGPPGVSGYEIVTESVDRNGLHASVTANCPAGKKGLGGGALADGINNPFEAPRNYPHLTQSQPEFGGTGWFAAATDPSEGKVRVRAWAICAFVM